MHLFFWVNSFHFPLLFKHFLAPHCAYIHAVFELYFPGGRNEETVEALLHCCDKYPTSVFVDEGFQG